MSYSESKKSVSKNSPVAGETKGTKTLFGEPKKAILKLSLPMLVAMSIQTLYNVVDAIWVSGLGADALAAVGFFFPFYFMVQGLANGVGVGGSSAISRRIGARDKRGADSVAVHIIIILVLLALIFSIPFFISAPHLFSSVGAGRTLSLAVSYGRIMFAGSIFIFFSVIANAILRAEGDAKRAMYAMVAGAIINIILDPIFIYVLKFGVAGAAMATVLALAISSIMLFNWLFIRKNTYVSFNFRGFKFSKNILGDIFKVGIPSSVQQLSMSFTALILNIIIVNVGGTDGVAVYSTGWRVVMIAALPLLGMATAVISVTGAAYGAKDFRKLNTAFLYAVKIGTVIEIMIAVLTFILAPQITAVFTQSKDAFRIADSLILFLRTMTVFYPGVAFGMLSSAMFQGTGKGINALLVTIFRTLILTLFFTLLFSFVLDMDLLGVWRGIVVGNLAGSVVAFVWARKYIMKLMRTSMVQSC
jgi:putative MATE family efflux protein